MDANLTPTQRIWKRRRARWAAWKAANPNATPRQVDRRRSRDWRIPTLRPQAMTWEQAVQQGKETQFLKQEGETD